MIATAGAMATGMWTPWRAFVHPAAAAQPGSFGASVPAARVSATPDQALAAARALVAPASPPTRLQIASIKVDAAVESVGLDSQGRMAVPSQASDVAWFQLGAAPGDVGDAVIAGHLDWTNGPAVFWYLGKLKKGDPITVQRADGSTVKFAVDSSKMVPYDSSTDSLFTSAGPPALTLITCAGTWDRQRGTYLQRLVVHATLVPTVSTDRPGDEGG
jgi:LPXTG-site transpeptidase (sortase) family protein